MEKPIVAAMNKVSIVILATSIVVSFHVYIGKAYRLLSLVITILALYGTQLEFIISKIHLSLRIRNKRNC
jgi:hypothetical protein